MNLSFIYDEVKDVKCLLAYGSNSSNSSKATTVYKQLIDFSLGHPTIKMSRYFIRKYITDNHLNMEELAKDYQKNWNIVSHNFIKKAENVFGIKVTQDITAYLTINNRRPYSIKSNYFFVTANQKSVRLTVMHELWHFYTWYKFGTIWEPKIGKKRYNDLKEALTVLLNIECKDLLPKGFNDIGYSQHTEIRAEIKILWEQTKDINKVWDVLIKIPFTSYQINHKI